MEIEFGFKAFPVWRGVQTEPGVKYALPYSIGWDSRGYISQKTDKRGIAAEDKITKVNPGMTKQEVVATLGIAPYEIFHGIDQI